MKLPDDQERLKGLLQETITLLCKNGLNYKAEFSVEALIVVTLDQEQMFHANIKETVAKEGLNISLDLDESPPSKSSHRKSAKKRRGFSDDSPEVPKKKSNSHQTHPDSHQTHPDEDDEDLEDGSNGSYHQSFKPEDEENSSECVIVKDELKSKKRAPIPLSDLEYVDQSGEQYSQQQHGVWSVQGGASGEGEISGMDGGEGSQQGEAKGRTQGRAGGMKLPIKQTPVRRTRQSEEQQDSDEDDTTPSVKIDTRGSVMHAGQRSGMMQRGGKWFKSKEASLAAGSPAQKVAIQGQSPKVRKSLRHGNVENEGETDEGSEGEDDQKLIEGEYFQYRPELVSVAPVKGGESKEGTLKGIIKQAVMKVREEIVPPIGIAKLAQRPGSIISATVTPTRRQRRRAPSPEIKVPRGRPVNPAVTSLPLSAESAMQSPVPLVAMDSPNVVRVTTRRQPIKVLSLEKESSPSVRPHPCQYCGTPFTSLESLSDHQCGEKNLFRCGICDAMFMRKENLKKHFNVHKDEVTVEVLESQ